MRALVEKFPNGLQEQIEENYSDQFNNIKHSGEIKLDPKIVAGKIVCNSVRDKYKC